MKSVVKYYPVDLSPNKIKEISTITENAKKLLEVLSEDQEFAQKASKANTIDEVIEMAKEKGIELTEEDVRSATNALGEVNTDEMNEVAGGSPCFCLAGGGGTGEEGVHGTCACVGYGCGENKQKHGPALYCNCIIVGTGY